MFWALWAAEPQGRRLAGGRSGGHDRGRRSELRQVAEVLGGGGEEQLVVGAARSSQSQAVEAQDALQVREQHLDLLPLPPSGAVGIGPGDVPAMYGKVNILESADPVRHAEMANVGDRHDIVLLQRPKTQVRKLPVAIGPEIDTMKRHTIGTTFLRPTRRLWMAACGAMMRSAAQSRTSCGSSDRGAGRSRFLRHRARRYRSGLGAREARL
jgi:hypothetical protein